MCCMFVCAWKIFGYFFKVKYWMALCGSAILFGSPALNHVLYNSVIFRTRRIVLIISSLKVEFMQWRHEVIGKLKSNYNAWSPAFVLRALMALVPALKWCHWSQERIVCFGRQMNVTTKLDIFYVEIKFYFQCCTKVFNYWYCIYQV